MVAEDQDRPIAIVVARQQTGLGMLRSLHAAGIPACVACPRDSLVTRSRWYRPIPGATHWDGEPGPQAYQILERMPVQRAVLITGRDDAALWAADIPLGPLADRFLVSSSSRATLETLQNKMRFGEFLARANIPHPRTFAIRTVRDIDAIPFGELDRVFIKPADSQKFVQVMHAKGIWVRNRAEFEQCWVKLEAQGLHVIAQEYVPGSPADHYFIDGFCDRQGRLTGLFARRRLRIFPPYFGNSSYCVSIPLHEVAEARQNLARLLEMLEYRGIFSAEFKRDSRDGQLRILEVNTRAWWYVEFATRCGVNVCRMAYEDACGMEVGEASRDYAIGVGCTNLSGDIRAILGRDRNQGIPLWRALTQWGHGYFSVFRWADPLPGLSMAWSEVSRLFRRIVSGRGRKNSAMAEQKLRQGAANE